MWAERERGKEGSDVSLCRASSLRFSCPHTVLGGVGSRNNYSISQRWKLRPGPPVYSHEGRNFLPEQEEDP